MTYFDQFDLKYLDNLDLMARQVVEGFIIGLHKSPFHGFSVEFAEHRLYNQGESTKNIDWKVFARTDKMFTKKYEEETNLRCQVVIDASSSMFYPKFKVSDRDHMNKFEFSCLGAASLFNLLKKQRDAFGLSLFNEDLHVHFRPKSSTKHYKLLLSYLSDQIANVSENKITSAAENIHLIAERIHRRSLVIIFSDMIERVGEKDDLFSALQHLKYNKHEVILFHVYDKERELDFNFKNRPYEFIDLETGSKLKVQPKEIRETYRKNIKAYFEELRMKCLQYKIDFVPVDIKDGYKSVLQSYLVKRTRMKA
jgi:uncharacterized protein (DUF58 family)